MKTIFVLNKTEIVYVDDPKYSDFLTKVALDGSSYSVSRITFDYETNICTVDLKAKL